MQDQTIEIDAHVGTLHFIDESNGDVIRSFGGRIEGCVDGVRFSVNVGNFWLNQLGRIRAFSRIMRIHRINVLRISKTKILIIYRNATYVYELDTRTLKHVFTFPFTHYVHTQSISVHQGRIVIGEYGNIGKNKTVDALISLDAGVTWAPKTLFAQGTVKNILAVKHDPFTGQYWVFTGDADSESGIHLYSKDLEPIEVLGKGVDFRAISAFFLQDKVVWLTNNPFGKSKVQVYDRTTGSITAGTALPGPVWYSSTIGKDVYCCTAAEDVAPPAGDHVYLLHSTDHMHWNRVATFKKDGLNKRLFLYGLGTFPQIGAPPTCVYLNMDAVQHFDGCVVKFVRPSTPLSHVE